MVLGSLWEAPIFKKTSRRAKEPPAEMDKLFRGKRLARCSLFLPSLPAKSQLNVPCGCHRSLTMSTLSSRAYTEGCTIAPAMRRLLALGVGLLAGAYLLARLVQAPGISAQSATTDWEKAAGGKMSFDVASAKLNTSTEHQPANFSLDANEGSVPAGGVLRASFQLITFIQFAYKLQLTPVQVSAILANQPRWFTADWFDIEAHGPANATKDQMRLMLQSLLADRFKLAVHVETRDQPVFALVLEKAGKMGPQLIPHSKGPPCDEAPVQHPESPNSAPSAWGIFPATCEVFAIRLEQGSYMLLGSRNTTMERLAASLGTLPEQTIDRPVMDKTGLTGRFDVTLKYTPDTRVSLNGATVQSDENMPTLLPALKEQLGLRLTAQTGPVKTLFIDHVEEPTPN